MEVYFDEVSKLFSNLNLKIKSLVAQHNESPDIEKRIYYRGFSVSKPYNVKSLMNLNFCLPDGKIGLLSDVNCNLNYPFHKIINTIEEASFILKSAIGKSDAFDDNEVELIQQKITYFEKKFASYVKKLLEIVLDKEKYNKNF